MTLDEITISRAIIERYTKKLLDCLNVEVAIVGGGPEGLVAAYYLAKAGKKTVIFEKNLSIGGGMWGGGIMFNEIVVHEEGKQILEEIGIPVEEYQKGYYCADSIRTITTLCSKAYEAGAQVFNLISIEDVVLKGDKICGLVINWSAVNLAGLHVDPIAIKTNFIIDASGHEAEIAKIIERKSGFKLMTETGKIIGEKPLWTDVGIKMLIHNTKEFYPGVIAAGMCANTVFGAPRMGPIFGGIIVSGKKAADYILKKEK